MKPLLPFMIRNDTRAATSAQVILSSLRQLRSSIVIPRSLRHDRTADQLSLRRRCYNAASSYDLYDDCPGPRTIKELCVNSRDDGR